MFTLNDVELNWHWCRIIAIFNVSSIHNDNEISNIRYEVINTQCQRYMQSDWISKSATVMARQVLEAGLSFSCSWIVRDNNLHAATYKVHPAVGAQWTWSPWFPFEVPIQGWMLPSENRGPRKVDAAHKHAAAACHSGCRRVAWITEQLVLLLISHLVAFMSTIV